LLVVDSFSEKLKGFQMWYMQF